MFDRAKNRDLMRLIVVMVLTAGALPASAAIAQNVPTIPHPPVEVTFDLNDFVTMLQWVFGSAAALLVVFAGLCVTFFGINIRDAKNNMDINIEAARVAMETKATELSAKATQLANIIDEARRIRDEARNEQDRARDKLDSMQKESSNILDNLKIEYLNQQILIKKKQNELEDVLRDAHNLIDKLRIEITKANDAGMHLQELEEPLVGAGQSSNLSPTAGKTLEEAKQDRIRELIKTSKFEWTTIGRVMRGTSLTRDEITQLVQNMKDVTISKGRASQDTIFKFK